MFETLRQVASIELLDDAMRGAVFTDPAASAPYLLHIAEIEIVRDTAPEVAGLGDREVLERRLLAIRQDAPDRMAEVPVEILLLLEGAPRMPVGDIPLVAQAEAARDAAHRFLDGEVVVRDVARWRQTVESGANERIAWVTRGFDFRESELAQRRSALARPARSGDAKSQRELDQVKGEQRGLEATRLDAIAAILKAPGLVEAGEVKLLAHALVLPSTAAEAKKRQDQESERIAMALTRAYEENNRAKVADVSRPELARQAGLTDYPGFDLLSVRPDGERRAIEVKGRAGVEDIELTANEWAKACNLGNQYWLYVAFECASRSPRLLWVQDPFGRLLARNKGSVVISRGEFLAVAQGE